MTARIWKTTMIAASIPMLLAVTPAAYAQTAPSDNPWRFDVGVGWDNGIGGNINSSAIGTLNDQVVVIKSNTYEEVYGTGLHLRFGGGYALNTLTELTGTFIFQSLDADQVVPMGDIGVSNLYGKYTDYQTFGLDVGLRRYLNLSPRFQPYGEGTIGIGFVDKTDITLVAPGANLTGEANDFYDQTAAWAMGLNLGMLIKSGGKIDFYGQLGFRWMSGMDAVDDFEGTGLETINDKSSRWTLPFVGGVRLRF